jgi:membrane protease YdiL (CAAX protease family)
VTARGWLYASEGTLRGVWRLLAFAAAVLVCAQLAQAFLYPVIMGIGSLVGQPVVAYPWVNVAAVIAAHLFCLRVVDRRPWSSVSMGRDAARPARLAHGTVVGALAITVPCALLLALGWLRRVPSTDGSSLGAAGLLAAELAPAALFEELLMRGYAFAVLRESAGLAWAVGLSSVVFGVLHLANPGADLRSTALVTLAGVFLAAVMVVLHSLYAAALAHLAWNWSMAALFHAPVSGLAFAMPDYRVVDAGPDWLTGGAWGPEGGAAAAAGMTAALLYLYLRGRAPRLSHTIARPSRPPGDLA